MKADYKEYCLQEYKDLFGTYLTQAKAKQEEAKKIAEEKAKSQKGKSKIIIQKKAGVDESELRRIAQKKAIKEASINAIKNYPEIEPSDLWKTIYVAHVYNVSGLHDSQLIDSVISADQSWKKSSGHAFEEMIKELGNLSLHQYNIEIILQRDLSELIKAKEIANEVRDISWLKEQIKSSVFDLYLTLNNEDGRKVFGCVQSKTSIRDRVTRDREPSINAMSAFFLSVAIVLDGSFLKLPKFTHMVNGNSADYEINGWHGMYVLTNEKIENSRIHNIDICMDKFVSDVVKASDYWTKNRQWFDHKWPMSYKKE